MKEEWAKPRRQPVHGCDVCRFPEKYGFSDGCTEDDREILVMETWMKIMKKDGGQGPQAGRGKEA